MALKTYTLAGSEKERLVFGKRFVIAESKKGTIIQTSGVAYTVEEPFDDVVADLEGKVEPRPEPEKPAADDGEGDE